MRRPLAADAHGALHQHEGDQSAVLIEPGHTAAMQAVIDAAAVKALPEHPGADGIVERVACRRQCVIGVMQTDHRDIGRKLDQPATFFV